MWKFVPFLIIALDIWIIFMQLKWEWFTDSKKEGLKTNTQEKLDALQKEIFMIEELVGQNTTMLQECKAIVGAKFDAIKKEKAEMQKKLLAARHGKVTKTPWPGVMPPSSMLPVPIQ